MEMDYNTQLEPLIIKEYGRNVQRMINHAKTIEDREERNIAVKDIIKVMELINPDPKKGGDHEHKLWDHMHKMAKNELDIDSPYEKPAEVDQMDKVASKPSYSRGRIKFRHYGNIVHDMIKITSKEEDPEAKQKMEQYLGAYMKLAYKQWNSAKMSDEVILQNIKDMSNGALELNEVVDITDSIPDNAANNNQRQAPRRKKTKRKKRR
ncbi:MAG: DUF4290 domain-containing protein [Bacteroidia bacterium]